MENILDRIAELYDYVYIKTGELPFKIIIGKKESDLLKSEISKSKVIPKPTISKNDGILGIMCGAKIISSDFLDGIVMLDKENNIIM